jgi:hypothetical protein
MPKIIDRESIRKLILSQQEPFSVADISVSSSNVSAPTIYSLIQELISLRQVIIDHKIGKRIYYGVSATAPASGDTLSHLKPIERMEYVKSLTDMVVEKYTPSLLVTGISGIGKTYIVRNRLREKDLVEGADYLYVQGHSSPLGLYALLHDNRKATIVFDDCDSVFKDDISINILKCALDSYATRSVSWHSSRIIEGLESSFLFTGSIIFISNWDAARIDEAIKSRTIVINLSMSRKEISDYMFSIIEQIEPQIDLDLKKEVFAFISERRDSFKKFDVRTLIKGCRIRMMSKRNNKDNWKELVFAIS